MRRRAGDADYRFMFEAGTPAHTYYRWRVYSLSQGDTLETYRRIPFQIVVGGPFWVPPRVAAPEIGADDDDASLGSVSGDVDLSMLDDLISSDDDDSDEQEGAVRADQDTDRARPNASAASTTAIAEDPDLETYMSSLEAAAPANSGGSSSSTSSSVSSTTLSNAATLAARQAARQRKKQRQRERAQSKKLTQLERLLQTVDRSRGKVCDTMMCALFHAVDAKDVVAMIAQSLSLPETPWEKKLARLYVLSDLLFNSNANVPHASAFRSYIQTSVKDVFKSLYSYIAAMASRSTQAEFSRRTKRVLGVWRSWALFPQSLYDDLDRILATGKDGQPTL